MTRKYLIISIFAAVVLFLGAPVSAVFASAKTAAPPSGITISPPLQQVAFPVAETSVPLNVIVTNNTPQTQTLYLSSVDFNALQDTGGLLFIGSKATALQRRYGLAKWLQLPYQQMTLTAGQSQTVDAAIRNDSTLAGGGHYGAILFTLRPLLDSGGQVSANLNAVASALVFAEKQGGIIYQLSLQTPHLGTYWSTLPSSVSLRFRNGGNVHLVPRGTVTITGPFSKKAVSEGTINEDSAIILPQNTRDYRVELSHSIGSLAPGPYKMQVAYRYDGNDVYQTVTVTFWVINLEGIAAILLIAVVLILLVLKRRAVARGVAAPFRRIGKRRR
jgi:hypothetical protein